MILSQPPWRITNQGSGATIAVLDSGFTRIHPALREVKVAEARSFTSHDPLVDLSGHGTECCSTLVARAGYGGPGGVAQDVRLIVGQIIEPHGLGNLEALCAALEWVSQLKIDILAIPSGRITDHPILRQRLLSVLASGALVIAPVGNPYNGQTGPLYPAAYPEVIGVGSQTFFDTYRTWSSPPDIIMGIHDVPVCTLDRGWRSANDTSQATMIVAGLACLLTALIHKDKAMKLTRSIFLDFATDFYK